MVTQQCVCVATKRFITGTAHNLLFIAVGATFSKTQRNKGAYGKS